MKLVILLVFKIVDMRPFYPEHTGFIPPCWEKGWILAVALDYIE